MKKKTILTVIIIAIILSGSILISTLGTKTPKDNNENNKTEQSTTTSFRTKMLSMNSIDLSKEEKLVLEYFDNSYTIVLQVLG